MRSYKRWWSNSFVDDDNKEVINDFNKGNFVRLVLRVGREGGIVNGRWEVKLVCIDNFDRSLIEKKNIYMGE